MSTLPDYSARLGRNTLQACRWFFNLQHLITSSDTFGRFGAAIPEQYLRRQGILKTLTSKTP